MRIYNRYLLFIVLVTCFINVTLAFLNQKDLTAYFTANVIAHMIITAMFINFSPRARKMLSAVSLIFVAGFIIVVVLKVIEVIR